MNASTVAQWDYTQLAATYDFRPDYCNDLIVDTLNDLGVMPGVLAVEVGAGTGKLTHPLLRYGLKVIATEPNEAMRNVALNQASLKSANWVASLGEAIPLRDDSVDLVAYGSSFNVLSAQTALTESARVLKNGGIWLALWNHRDLDDPLQSEVEATIRHHVPNYDYGRRRVSPASDVANHGAFTGISAVERRFVVVVKADDWLLAWQSHATLQRQAGTNFPIILKELSTLLGNAKQLDIPYFTRAWFARRVTR